jgi:phosphate transport system substrate-binding protein
MAHSKQSFRASVVAISALLFSPAFAVDLKGAGATFPAPLYKGWIERFEKDHPGVKITYDAVGSGEGVARFTAGAVDFAGSDVPIPTVDDDRAGNMGVQFPVTAGMVALAYRLPGVAGPLNLPRSVYIDIFLGKIRRWDDPKIVAANPRLRLPALDITVVARSDSSGTTYAFTTHAAHISGKWGESGVGVGKKASWPATVALADGNQGVATRIKERDGSIGYVEYGVAKRTGLPVAALENRAGKFVGPSPEAGAAAFNQSSYLGLDHLKTSILDPTGEGAYPIVSYSWLILRWEYPSEQLKAMNEFVEFILGEGQKRALEMGYVPLPGPVAYRGKAVLGRIFPSEGAEGAMAAAGAASTAGSVRSVGAPAAPVRTVAPAR